MPKAHLKLVTPAIVKRTVVPRRPPNANLRTREHLTEAEVERLMNAARKNRWGHRDATMVLVAYRHGFRPAELVDLRWDQIDFTSGALHVRRVKRGTPSTHPILGDELRALRRLQREQDPKSPFVFTSERGAPFSTAGFARMIARAGAEARLGFKAHPHMLRHACGFARSPQGARHPSPAGLPGPSEYPTHGALHGIVASTVSGFLAMKSRGNSQAISDRTCPSCHVMA
jgi:integrase